MVCLYTHLSFEENMNLIRSEQYTRYPVAEGDKDRIVGMVNVKDLFLAYTLDSKEIQLMDHVHPVLIVIETTPVQDLLKRMQKERKHMAVLIDEYGGTSGLLTLEDIVEEIVGEIRDEFDAEEKPMVEIGKDHWVLDGKVLIGEVNDLLGMELHEEDMDTIGGWLYTHLPEVKEGVEVDWEGYRFQVKEMDRLRISLVEIRKLTNESSNI
jgi:CBS domain containing-hemolysin-like protein